VPSVAWFVHEHTTTVLSASAPGDAPPQVPGVALRSKTTAGSRFAVPGIESLGGEEAVKTFAIAGGGRVVGNCG